MDNWDMCGWQVHKDDDHYIVSYCDCTLQKGESCHTADEFWSEPFETEQEACDYVAEQEKHASEEWKEYASEVRSSI